MPEVYVNTFEPQKEAMRWYPSKNIEETGFALSGIATGTLTLHSTVTCQGDPKEWHAAILDGTARLPIPVVLEAWNGLLTTIEAVFAEMTPVTSGVGMQSIFEGSACQNINDPLHAAMIASQKEKAAKGLILQPAYAAYIAKLSMDELLQAATAEPVVESAQDGNEVSDAQDGKEVSDAPGGKEVSDAPGGQAVESAVAQKPLIEQLAALSIAPKFHPQVDALLTFTPEFVIENDEVKMTDENPFAITVRNHDGRDDERE